MSKAQWKALALGLVAILTTIILAFAATAPITLAQVTNVSQYTDVKPSDYYFEALRGIVERYGCAIEYEDGTFRANRPVTRGELAENLNACLQQLERKIPNASADSPQENQASIASLEQKVQSLQQAVESIRRSRQGTPSNEPI
jgi:hypothetical protein